MRESGRKRRRSSSRRGLRERCREGKEGKGKEDAVRRNGGRDVGDCKREMEGKEGKGKGVGGFEEREKERCRRL